MVRAYRRRNKPIITLALLIIVCLFSSCAKRNYHEADVKPNLQAFREQEAKLVNIPIPFGSKPLAHFVEHIQESELVMLGYENEMPAKDLYNFYIQEMERLGWQQKSSFAGPEYFLLFTRPGKTTAISIRPSTPNTEIIIYA